MKKYALVFQFNIIFIYFSFHLAAKLTPLKIVLQYFTVRLPVAFMSIKRVMSPPSGHMVSLLHYVLQAEAENVRQLHNCRGANIKEAAWDVVTSHAAFRPPCYTVNKVARIVCAESPYMASTNTPQCTQLDPRVTFKIQKQQLEVYHSNQSTV